MYEGTAPRNVPAGSPDDGMTLADTGRFEPVASPPLPENIGRYRVIRLLGEGGMGAVYEAEQDQPRRRVALKVIKAAWASPTMLKRFELESQSLGRLHHVGIAQIYEAGSAETPFGVQPFFAMELIQGQPLVEYADARKLDTRQRLALMIQVCEAAQHAHQNGIIHRDLKPGNILVDESGQPKILDFGLARVTDSDAQATRQTDMGQLLGTLAYMSPEQVLADPLGIDTRSDVYALGVILYQLLASRFPYPLPREIHEVVQTIRNVDPAPLSSVNNAYRGDIETIVAKALEKDRERRYASAADLAADIQRYLNDQPIAAKPASAVYQLQKFARRHKTIVASAAAVLLALVLGIIASTWEAVRARRAEATAKQESAIALAVNEFLQKDILGQASAYNQSKPDPDLKVRAALDRAAQNIQGKFDKQPDVEASIRDTIGKSFHDLGLYPEARAQFERVLELDRRVYGSEHPKTIGTMLSLAATEEAEGKYPEAEAMDKQVLNLSRRVQGPGHPATIRAMNRLASVYDYEGKYADGEVIASQAVALSRQTNGPESTDTLNSMFFLAILYYEEGKFAEADSLGNQLVEARRRVLGPEHPDTLSAMNNLAATYAEERKLDESIALNKQIVEIRTRVLGPEHPDTLDSTVNLAFDNRVQHKYAEAEALDRKVLEIQRRVLGPEHPLTLRSMHNLAVDIQLQGHNEEAEALDTQLLEIRRRTLGPDNPDTLWSMSSLALDYRADGKYAQAATLDRQTLEKRSRILGPDNPSTVNSMFALADDYKGLGDYAQVESIWRTALAANPDSPKLLNYYAWFLSAVEDHRLRRPKDALDLSQRAVKLASESQRRAFYNTLGLAEIRNGLWNDAIADLEKSAKLQKEEDPNDFFFLAIAQHARGDNAAAEHSLARGIEIAAPRAAKDSDLRMFWAEAAEALGKPGPGPTLLEVKAEPARSMERLKHAAAAGHLKPETLKSSPDLAPLRNRPDFQALLKDAHAATTSSINAPPQ
jgi:eukaryotic-like serine/threonine-protein kinase